MKKRFDLIDLDCANCAAKMEEAIKKLEGVEEATVSFMAQKLTIEADEEKFDKIMKQVVKAIKKVDSDCEVVL
ncbi:MAG: cation transporter [Lachnospiraceae bacterium]|nr:cation transporter [Lachnospiraceae bacterium]MBQ9234012.1 cation transporter [Lachnospiraceae bacterium]